MEDSGTLPSFHCRIQQHPSVSVVYCRISNGGYYRIELTPGQPRRQFCVVEQALAKKDMLERVCKSLGGVGYEQARPGYRFFLLN